MSNVQLVLWSGWVIGLSFGAVGQITGFCLHRGLVQQFQGQPGQKLRSFALALLIAIVGTQWLAASNIIDLSKSIYWVPTFSWLLVPLGGLLFGCGMTLTKGCSARALVLLGQGNLRSAVVLLCIGVAAYATLTGVLAPVRTLLAEMTPVTPAAWSDAFARPDPVFAAGLIIGLAVFSLWKAALFKHPKDLFGGIIMGLLVVGGWLATGYLGFDDFDPVPLESITFVAPVGGAIQYLMIATGVTADFGVVVVGGILLGSLAAALVCGRFEWQGFESAAQMRRYMLGGILMGIGGALAMGCSVGQGLTGVSTLAPVSAVALLGILAGSYLAQKTHA